MKWNNLSLQALFATLLPVIQSLRQTVLSEVWLMNKSFFWTSYFWWTSSPNRTEASETVQGSNSTDLQVFQSKLTFRHAWQSLWLEMSQNTAYRISWCWFLLIQHSHTPIVLLYQILIYCQEPRVFILCSLICTFFSHRLTVAHLLFMNHQEPQFQLKFFFTVLLNNKKINYIFDGLRVRK